MKKVVWKMVGYEPGIICRQWRIILSALLGMLFLIFLVWALQGFPTAFEKV